MQTFDKTWSLFLDRDGVINKRLVGDYVKKWEEFNFIPGSLRAIEKFSSIFGRIFIVTNQAGIGKGVMTLDNLNEVHRLMLKTITLFDGRIDKIYFAPEKDSHLRKPNTGMPEQAKIDFPDIDFSRSVMVGDSNSDMEMGNRLGMVKVFIEGKKEDPSVWKPHFQFKTLLEFAETISD
jgi:histidinol-phosphate phosphatase family protein